MITQTKTTPTIIGTQILREISQEEVKKLKPIPGVLSIAVILDVPITHEYGKELSFPVQLVVKEEQDFGGNPFIVSKKPSGGMNDEDIDIFAAAFRELINETGHTVDKWHFGRAVETTSTKFGERHIKVFLVGENAKEIGEPLERSIKEVLKVPMNKMRVGVNMTRDQLIGAGACIEVMKFMNRFLALALMNHRVPEWEPRLSRVEPAE